MNVRSWSDRLSYLTARQNWTEAFELAIEGFRACAEKPRRHGITKERILLLYDDYLKVVYYRLRSKVFQRVLFLGHSTLSRIMLGASNEMFNRN